MKTPRVQLESTITTPQLRTRKVAAEKPQNGIPRDSNASKPSPETKAMPPYTPPSGLVSYLPNSLVPFAELMRLHKPSGFYAFYFPHLFGTLYAATTLPTPPLLLQLLYFNIYFAIACIFLRGAACTWNDTLDAPFDRQVARCCNRPVARGAVSPVAAHAFTVLQSIICGLLLWRLPRACDHPALLLTTTMAIYPFCKRVTNFPQVLLGFSFSFGQLVAFAGFDVDPFELYYSRPGAAAGLACMYAANVVNTMIYDTVYAHQDLKDDLKAGVMSMAVACMGRARTILSVLSALEVGLLVGAGMFSNMGALYLVGAGVGTAAVLGWMLWTVRLDVPGDCGWWFSWSIWLTGGTLSGALFAEYLARY